MSLANASTLLLGGIPSHKDLVPSCIFTVFYVVLFFGWLYRICRNESRSTLMIRPGLFIIARIVTLGIRAHMSGGKTYAEGYFIAEIILITVGFVLLIEPVISCFGSQIYDFAPPPPSRFAKLLGNAPPVAQNPNTHWLGSVAKILKFALLGIMITGALIGSDVNKAIDDPTGSAASSVKTYRLVNYILGAAIIGIVLLATALAQLQYPHILEARKSAFIIGCCSMLLVPSIYKLFTLNHSHPSAFVHSTAAFFILLITIEAFVCSLLILFPITVMFPSERARRRQLTEQLEAGGRTTLPFQNFQGFPNPPQQKYSPGPNY